MQWSAIEAHVGIICASLMALKPLVVRYYPTLLTDNETPQHAMHIRTIEDGEGPSFWTGGSVSTTCAASEGTLVAPPDGSIKVTTETEKFIERRSSSMLERLSGLWGYTVGPRQE